LVTDFVGCGLLGGMSERLDVRVAIAEASGVFGRFPVAFSLPILLAYGLPRGLSEILSSTGGPRSHWTWLVAMFGWLLYSFAQVLAAAISMRVREGGRPEIHEVLEV
jgi:hypothetical protein